MFDQAPLTVNDPEVTTTVAKRSPKSWSRPRHQPPRILGGEDFSDIANGVGAPYTFLAVRRCRSHVVLRR